jgi:hypothetical protein
MDLIIPTYGRPYAQDTLRHLSQAGFLVHLVIQHREHLKYQNLPAQLWILPPYIETIAPTRQWIVENVGSSDKILMLDDDLTFFTRRDDDRTKFRDSASKDLLDMLTAIEVQLRYFAHVGIAAREGGNRNTETILLNTRIMRVLGYRRDVLKATGIKFNTMEVMEDFHVALSLLELGYANVICNDWCQNQAGSGKSGGCSHFRTPELHAHNAQKLHDMHPQFVKVVEKTTKGAWGGGTRTDVQISWKKAYADGVARHGARVLD